MESKECEIDGKKLIYDDFSYADLGVALEHYKEYTHIGSGYVSYSSNGGKVVTLGLRHFFVKNKKIKGNKFVIKHRVNDGMLRLVDDKNVLSTSNNIFSKGKLLEFDTEPEAWSYIFKCGLYGYYPFEQTKF